MNDDKITDATQAGKHTPGPWCYTKAAVSGDRGIYACGTGIFAEAFADIRRAGENNAAEALANARLIAAAPDGLEFAQNAIASGLLDDVLTAAAKAFVAKATGDAQ